jgi:Na+/proline symporter
MLSPTVLLAVIIVHFLVLAAIAHWSSRNTSNASFFVANRNAPWWLVGIGTVGATISGITFVSVPGAVGTAGVNKDFSYMQFVFGTMVGYLVTAYILLPVYYRMNLVSIYGYLESRFGPMAQKTGAVFFMVARIVGSSLRLYLLALALQKFVLDSWGVPFGVTAVVIPLLIWSYTFRGGTKTVLITDTLQTFLFVICVVLTLRDLAVQMGGSHAKLFSAIQTSAYSQIFFFKSGWQDPNNFFKQFLAGALMTTCTTGLDQDLMQKNLSCRNLHQCRKNLLLSSTSMLFVNYLFLMLGAGLYLFAASRGVTVLSKSDELYPMLAFGYLSPSIGLVFMMGLLSTTYSTSDSALTSLTTSFCVDILGFERRAQTLPEPILRRIRLAVHFGFTLVFIGMMFVFGAMGNGAVLNTLFQAHGFTYGPILGLFAFGLLTRRRVRDRYIGVLAGVAILLTWWIDSHTGIWFSGLQLGFLRLALNGSIMFIGLCLLAIGVRRPAEKSFASRSGVSTPMASSRARI